MHTIQNILKISPSGAVLSDQYGSTTGISLEIMLGTAVSLEFDLRQENSSGNSTLPAYPAEKLLSGAYYCAFDTSCSYSDSPLLLQISGIALASVGDKTIFTVTIPDTAVEKMISALAGKESLVMLCEIGGISTDGKAAFAWHFPVTVRNRVFAGNGTPTIAGDPEYYTAVQVEAAISRPLLHEYSADGGSWHTEFVSGDKWWRMRHGGNGVFSAPVPLPQGEKGEKGEKGDSGDFAVLTDEICALTSDIDDWGNEYYPSDQISLSLEGGKRYLVDTQGAGSFIISGSVGAVGCEIWFTMTADMTISFPESLGWIGTPSFEAGKNYIISIRYNVASAVVYTPGA